LHACSIRTPLAWSVPVSDQRLPLLLADCDEAMADSTRESLAALAGTAAVPRSSAWLASARISRPDERADAALAGAAVRPSASAPGADCREGTTSAAGSPLV